MYVFQSKDGVMGITDPSSHVAIANVLGSWQGDLGLGEWKYCGGMHDDPELYRERGIYLHETGEYLGRLFEKRD